jgi:hypothetical protein
VTGSLAAALTGFNAVPTIYSIGLMKGAIVSLLDTVSFQHITRILGVIDDLEISREAVEIPLSTEKPGVVRRLANGKWEIVVDADIPFDDWLQTLPQQIQALMPEDSESD